jgi:hypothetical protein
MTGAHWNCRLISEHWHCLMSAAHLILTLVTIAAHSRYLMIAAHSGLPMNLTCLNSQVQDALLSEGCTPELPDDCLALELPVDF